MHRVAINAKRRDERQPVRMCGTRYATSRRGRNATAHSTRPASRMQAWVGGMAWPSFWRRVILPSMNATGRKIIHIDMDAFYASVEQRDDPRLRGIPLAVGGSRERGVVAAASYEARKFGVRSAMASVTAAGACPGLMFVPPRFEIYRAISAQIRGIFAAYTSLVEPLSLDEAYLDVTPTQPDAPFATQIARDIRAAIFRATGLTASAGISYNKFLAKLASDHRKPNGQFTIPPEMGPGFVEPLPVGRFHGVGPATEARMKALGIHTGADLRRCTEAFLTQ